MSRAMLVLLVVAGFHSRAEACWRGHTYGVEQLIGCAELVATVEVATGGVAIAEVRVLEAFRGATVGELLRVYDQAPPPMAMTLPGVSLPGRRYLLIATEHGDWDAPRLRRHEASGETTVGPRRVIELTTGQVRTPDVVRGLLEAPARESLCLSVAGAPRKASRDTPAATAENAIDVEALVLRTFESASHLPRWDIRRTRAALAALKLPEERAGADTGSKPSSSSLTPCNPQGWTSADRQGSTPRPRSRTCRAGRSTTPATTGSTSGTSIATT